MKDSQLKLLIESSYNNTLILIVLVFLGVVIFFTPVGDVLMGTLGLVSIYSLLPVAMYILAILRGRGVTIVLLLPLVVSILSLSTFSALIGSNGTLMDGGVVGHTMVKVLFVALSNSTNAYWWIFGGSLAVSFLSVYSLYIFARGHYGST